MAIEVSGRLSPQGLVHQHPHSFFASVSEIRSAFFEPGTPISIPHARKAEQVASDCLDLKRLVDLEAPPDELRLGD